MIVKEYFEQGYAKQIKEQYAEAISDFKIAIELNPNDPITYLNLGQTYYNLGSKNDTTYFDKAIELDENMFEAHFARGNALLCREEYERAVISLTRAIELEPTWSAFYLCRAIGYESIGDYQNALNDLKKAKQLKPDDADIDKSIEDCQNEIRALAKTT